MRLILTAILVFCSYSMFAQNVDQQFLVDAERYRTYQKDMYIDFMPKKIIPSILRKEFYTDLSPQIFTNNIGQQMDTTAHVQKLYLTTKKAGMGFISVNRGALNEMDIASSIVYVYNNDTVTTANQASELYTLEGNDLKLVKYDLIPQSKTLIVKIDTK